MKRLFTLIAVLFLAMVAAFGQNNKLSYQAVVRNSANELVANENITVVISILNGTTADAPVAYSEQHTVTTNQNGLMSLLIGDGTNQTGSFADVQWDNASVKSEITLPDGNVTSIVPMTAVPYALYAANANAGITAKDLENFIDTVTLPTALSVYGHVSDSLNPQIKEGLKTWVAQVAKNNPNYVMDVAKYYVTYVDTNKMDELLGADNDNVLNYAFDQLAPNSIVPQMIHDSLANIPEQVQSDWDESDTSSKAYILNKPGVNVINLWKTIPTDIVDNPNIPEPFASFVVYGIEDDDTSLDFELPLTTTRLMMGDSTIAQFTTLDSADLDFELPGFTLTAKDLENFIDTVTLPTALSVYGHVHDSLDSQIKQGLKTWVAQVVKNNPTYAMDVLTHYIKNLTPAQVTEIFGAYDDMTSAQAKNDLLNGIADIIKDNPAIAYDVLNHYIDNVTLAEAMDVYGHINTMNDTVKRGLKMWVAQVAKNNPEYVIDIAKYYVTYATQAVVDELVAADNDNALGYAFDKVAASSDTIAALRAAIPAAANNGMIYLHYGDEPTQADNPDNPNAVIDNSVLIGSFGLNDAADQHFYIPAPAEPTTANIRLMMGDSTIAAFTTLDETDQDFELPAFTLTAKDLENFIDTVTLPTALSVYGHVNTMNDTIKRGLKTWVAQVVKNNPTYAMDVLTHYIKNLTPAQVTEIFGAYDDMTSDQAKNDLLNGIADIIKDNPAIAYDVIDHYIDNVTLAQAMDVYSHINTMNDTVKRGLKLWVAQVAKNNPEYVMDIAKHYVTYADQSVVDELVAADNDNALGYAFDKVAANSDTIAALRRDINAMGTEITAKDLENFIDTVTLPTALGVYGHVNTMNDTIKRGLKTWVAQVVKNNPTYAMDVLTHYIENLTSDQVTEIFGAYGDMDAQPKADLLNGLAQIIKDNPAIAYDVLNDYIDNVTLAEAMNVYGHINTMNDTVKRGLKTWVAQVAKNNPTYVYDVLDYYLGNTTASTSVGEAITNYAANHKDVAKAIVANYLQNGTAQDVDEMVAALLQNQAGGRAQFQNYLNAYIDSRLGTETSQKFSATAGQTSFTLNQTPKSNYVVRLFINGVMVGDSATGVVTVSGTTVTYVPAQNDNYSLVAGDKIIISYFK